MSYHCIMGRGRGSAEQSCKVQKVRLALLAPCTNAILPAILSR